LGGKNGKNIRGQTEEKKRVMAPCGMVPKDRGRETKALIQKKPVGDHCWEEGAMRR